MGKRIYLYPLSGRNRSGITNPYVWHLAEALGTHHVVVNAQAPSEKGFLDILRYSRELDILYLNWIENLPGRHMGGIQSAFFLLFRMVARVRGMKIVWTLHNKKSHSDNRAFLKKRMFRYMLRHSDLIITHAREGLAIVPPRRKALYIPHPVAPPPSIPEPAAPDFDLVIWGSIARYKGIHSFLDHLVRSEKMESYRILLAGKIVEADLKAYFEDLDARYDNLTLMDAFHDKDVLDGLIARSRIVVFPYIPASVLSSGALMDSLHFPAEIIGPDAGAFADMGEEGIIHCYADYDDLIRIIEGILSGERATDPETRKKFIRNNTWASFGEKARKMFENV